MHLQHLRERQLPPGRVVAQVQLAHGCAGAQRGAHVLDAFGQQVVVRHVEHRERLVRAEATRERTDVLLQLAQRVTTEVERLQCGGCEEHPGHASGVLVLDAHPVVHQVELLE